MAADEITRRLRDAFADAEITLVDTAGDGDHYQLTLASRRFAGLSRVAQHRLVYDALGGEMGAALHALALTTKAL